jgi:hypothetical protein
MNIVGFNYQQERSFNAMEGATGFTGQSGNTVNQFQNLPNEGAQGALPGPVDFWGGSESFSWWVLRQGALMGVSVLVLAAALYLLGKSGRWAGRRGS